MHNNVYKYIHIFPQFSSSAFSADQHFRMAHFFLHKKRYFIPLQNNTHSFIQLQVLRTKSVTKKQMDKCMAEI